MARNRFSDPNAVRATYDWPVNHSDEEQFGKQRSLEHGALTGDGGGLVAQQSDSQPLTLRWSGTIFHESQVTEMIAWWELCETQTVHISDFAGDSYEVTIVNFNPVRKRTIRNPRDFANAPFWYWTYELDMEVVRVIDGVWSGVTP